MKKIIFTEVLLLIVNIVAAVLNNSVGNNFAALLNSFAAGVLFMSIIVLSDTIKDHQSLDNQEETLC